MVTIFSVMEGNNNYFRVSLKCTKWKMPLSGWLSIGTLEEIFNFECDKCRNDVIGILGSEFLYPALPRLILSSQVLSLFLTYVMDLLLDSDAVVHIADKVVCYNVIGKPKIEEEVRKFDLQMCLVPIGGVFNNMALRRDESFQKFL